MGKQVASWIKKEHRIGVKLIDEMYQDYEKPDLDDVDDWEFVEKTGRLATYQKDDEFIIVFRGTTQTGSQDAILKDLYDDITLTVGNEDKVELVKEGDDYLKKLLSKGVSKEKISLTGHSLGGYAALKVSDKYNINSFVFNAAASPLNPVKKGPGPKDSTNYHIVGDGISSHMGENTSKIVRAYKKTTFFKTPWNHSTERFYEDDKTYGFWDSKRENNLFYSDKAIFDFVSNIVPKGPALPNFVPGIQPIPGEKDDDEKHQEPNYIFPFIIRSFKKAKKYKDSIDRMYDRYKWLKKLYEEIYNDKPSRRINVKDYENVKFYKDALSAMRDPNRIETPLTKRIRLVAESNWQDKDFTIVKVNNDSLKPLRDVTNQSDFKSQKLAIKEFKDATKMARQEIEKSNFQRRESGLFDKPPDIFRKPNIVKSIDVYNKNLKSGNIQSSIRSSLATSRPNSNYRPPSEKDMVDSVRKLQQEAGAVKTVFDLQNQIDIPPPIKEPSPASEYQDFRQKVYDGNDGRIEVPRTFDIPPIFDQPPPIKEPSPASRLQDEMVIDKPTLDSGLGRTIPLDIPPPIKEPSPASEYQDFRQKVYDGNDGRIEVPRTFDIPPMFDQPPDIYEPSPASRLQDDMVIDEPTLDSGWGRTIPLDVPPPINGPSPASTRVNLGLQPNAMVVYDVDVEGGVEDVRDMQTKALGKGFDSDIAGADLKWRSYKRAAARQVAAKQLIKKGYQVDIGFDGDRSSGRIVKTAKRSVNPIKKFISLFLRIPL